MKRHSVIWASQPLALALLLGMAAPLAAEPMPAAEPPPPHSLTPSLPHPLTPSPPDLASLLAARPVVNETVSIDQAVAIALRESPVVRGAAAEVEAAAGRVSAARAETRPWLSANSFISGGSNSSIVASPPVSQPQMIMALPRGAFFDQNLALMAPLYTGGRLRAMVRQAQALRNASQADLEAQRQEVTLLTRAAAYELLARRALVTVWQARLREDQERLRLDQERLKQEQIPPVYVRRDEAEVAATQQEVTNARRDVDLALVQLRTVLGVHPASRLDLSGSLEYQPSRDLISRLTALSPPGGDRTRATSDATPGAAVAGAGSEDQRELQALVSASERQRPELQAAGERVRGAEQENAAVRGAYRPQVSIAAMGDFMKARSQDPFTGVTYGVIASLPLANGGQRRARVQTAQAEIRRQKLERERLALQVAQEIASALLNLRAAEQNIQTARAALAAAREEYRVALLRYQSGRSVVVEALDALAARVRAEGNEVQALFQYNLERDRLLRAVGALNR